MDPFDYLAEGCGPLSLKQVNTSTYNAINGCHSLCVPQITNVSWNLSRKKLTLDNNQTVLRMELCVTSAAKCWIISYK